MRGIRTFFFLSIGLCLAIQSVKAQRLPEVGITGSVSQDSLYHAAGLRYVEEGITSSFSPRKWREDEFQGKLDQLNKARVKAPVANVFFPGEIKLVGPSVDEKIVLGYVDTVMRRCREAGVKIVVLGSGGSRRIPEGYDSIRAAHEFQSLLRKMAGVAQRYDRIIAMENLNHTETNFVLTLEEAILHAKAVDHPNFKLTADIYHMLMENEAPASIEAAGDLLVHMHIAEKEERAYPGKRKTDFVPYFRALRKTGYKGRISMECRWWDMKKEAGPAKAYLEDQLVTAGYIR
jgi:sugar phosphate isomerase/epimerase